MIESYNDDLIWLQKIDLKGYDFISIRFKFITIWFVIWTNHKSQ